MRMIALIGGWCAVVVFTTALTWQIVSAADAQVTDSPVSPLNVAAPVFDTTPTSSTTTTTTTVAPTTVAPTTVVASTTETSAPATTATSEHSSTTTTTTSLATSQAWTVKVVSTAGGQVVLKYRQGEVVYQTATPAPGFRVEIEKPGPPEVELEFESESLKIEIHAKWDSGELKVEISESDED